MLAVPRFQGKGKRMYTVISASFPTNIHIQLQCRVSYPTARIFSSGSDLIRLLAVPSSRSMTSCMEWRAPREKYMAGSRPCTAALVTRQNCTLCGQRCHGTTNRSWDFKHGIDKHLLEDTSEPTRSTAAV